MRKGSRLWPRWIRPSVAVAAFLFVWNHTAVTSGALAPPPGYVPQYVVRNTDMTVYPDSMQATRHAWLAPNFSPPWPTSNELLTPILAVMGHMSNFMPWPVFSGRQRLAAIAVISCSVPFLSIWCAIAKVLDGSPGYTEVQVAGLFPQ